MSWEGATSAGDFDLSYGLTASAKPTSDISTLPRTFWGKASTKLHGWGVSARADIDAQDLSGADLQIDASNDEYDAAVRVMASTKGIRSIQATKGFDVEVEEQAHVTVTPRLDVEHGNKPDVEIKYDSDSTHVRLIASADNQEIAVARQIDDTNICLTASAEDQAITITQQIDDQNRLSPTISRSGDVSLEWERLISDQSSVTAKLNPGDSLDLEWRDQEWTANINMPIDGTSIQGSNVSIKRDVNF